MGAIGMGPGRRIAFTGVRLLDGRSPDAVEEGTLLVAEDGRIAAAGPARSVHVPDDAVRVDGGGATLVPGLIDCHVHLTGAHEATDAYVQRSATDIVVRALRTGQDYLESGVTTVRDAGGAPAGIRRAFASGEMPGPRTQVSVMYLSQTGGHGDGWTPSGADLNGTLPPDLPNGICDGVAECRKAARLQIRAGADWIKVMATGGVYSLADTPDAAQFTPEELRAIVEEAEAAGIRGVLAHAEGTRGIKNAIRAGVRSIEHGDLLDEEGMDLMLAGDVALVPTFLIVEEMLRPDRVEDGTTPPWAVEKVERMRGRQRESFAEAVRRGVRVAMGTDGGAGSHLPSELALMVEAGLDPLAALRAATVDAARLLGLDREVGTLEAGKLADLVLVSGDPPAEPALWRDPSRIALVTQAGRVFADRRGAAS
jgi:imidazolonepropionase-like amidohydrolase